MARIPEDLLARVKREVGVLDRVRTAGLELTRHGANWVARCPWHEDHTPSLVITPSKNLWHCLGACQVGGSVVDWEMRWAKVSFREAVERLRVLVPGGMDDMPNGSPALELDPAADDATLLGQVVGFYHRTLTQSPEALATSSDGACAMTRRSRTSSSASRTGRWRTSCRRRCSRRGRRSGAACRR
jgi:hypothetical protein